MHSPLIKLAFWIMNQSRRAVKRFRKSCTKFFESLLDKMKIETSILSKYCYERIVSIPHMIICFKEVLSVLKLTVNCQDVKLHLIVLKLNSQIGTN